MLPGVFIAAVLGLYWRLKDMKDEWTRAELLTTLAFGGIIASSVTFLTLVAIAMLSEDLSQEILTEMELLLLGQLMIFILYPLIEFIYLAKIGPQATESYHIRLEAGIEYLRKYTKNEIITGIGMYLGIFVSFLYILLIINIHSITEQSLTSLLFIYLAYPAIILGYYAAKGTFEALKPALYLRKYLSIGVWIGIIALLITVYSVLSLVTGLPLGEFILKILRIFFAGIELPAWTGLLFFYLPILFSLILTIYGFYADYWKVKALTRLFDYLLTAYLFSALGTLTFISLVIMEELAYIPTARQLQFKWLNIQTESLIVNILLNIKGVVIIFWLIVIILRIKYGKDESFKNYLRELITRNIQETYRISPVRIINNWKKVETLDISQCQIKELPETIKKMKKLRKLNVCKNEIGALPKGICKLTTLETLEIEKNKIKSLPEGFSNLTTLLKKKYPDLKPKEAEVLFLLETWTRNPISRK
jgi:hypothetical protein